MEEEDDEEEMFEWSEGFLMANSRGYDGYAVKFVLANPAVDQILALDFIIEIIEQLLTCVDLADFLSQRILCSAI